MRYILIILILIIGACQSRDKAEDVPVYFTKLTPEVKALRNQADSIRKTDVKSSLPIYKLMLQKAQEQKNDLGLVEAYRNIVFVSGALLGDLDSGLFYADQSIEFAHHLGDANTLCDMYGNKAVTYQAAGMLDSAVENYKVALRYMDEDTAPDSLKNWPLYLNISEVYSRINNQPLAIEYTEKYLNDYVIPKGNDTMRLESSYNNLGLYYLRMDDTINARKYLFKAYDLSQHLRMREQANNTVFNLFIFYFELMADYDSAAIFANKALELSKESGLISNQMQNLTAMAALAYTANDTDMARQLTANNNLFNFFIDENVSKTSLWPLFYKYAQLFEMTGDQHNAYQHLKVAHTMLDEIRQEQANKDLEEYELEKKRVMQENKILANELQIKNKNNTILILIITFLIIAAIGSFILYFYKKKINAQKREVELLEIEKVWEKERSELKGQLDERNRISRELHDDLGASLTSIALSGEMIKRKNPSIKEEMQTITSSANDIVDTLNEIVWSLNSRNDSLHGLVAYIRKFATGFLNRANISTTIRDHIPTDDLMVTSEIRRSIYLTAKEAINNIVKHSNAQNASIDFHFDDSRLSISIKDDGDKQKSMSTNMVSGGNGLLNMKNNMELINGSFEYEDHLDQGFKVIIISPILEKSKQRI